MTFVSPSGPFLNKTSSQTITHQNCFDLFILSHSAQPYTHISRRNIANAVHYGPKVSKYIYLDGLSDSSNQYADLELGL